MIELCNIVVESLENQGIKCQKLHPHKLNIKGTNADFKIDQFHSKATAVVTEELILGEI